MKKSFLIKVFAITIALVVAFCTMAACGRKQETSDSEYEREILTANGEDIEDYSIVISAKASTSDEYAAQILQSRIKQATGMELPIIKDNETKKQLEIILGKTTRKECGEIDFSSLGEESYKVMTVGKDLVIAGNDRGLIYGVYAYLEAIGFRFYTPDTEKIPYTDEVFVPQKIDISWSPVFEYREPMYCSGWNAEWALTQKINSDFMRNDLRNNSKYGGYSGYIGGNKWLVHTFQYLLPESQYFSDHPEYFAEVDGQRITDPIYGAQPCLSNEAVYNIILNNALTKISTEPNGKMISISENDNKNYCQCEQCRALYAEYGVSGTFFRFLNRLAKDIGEVYPDVKIDTLSYEMLGTMTAKIPEGVEIADNIIVRVCPTMCNFHTGADKCELLAENEKLVSDWTKICKNVYVYIYPIVWGNIFTSLPNYKVMYYDVRFFAEQGVKGVYAEGYPLPDPEFGELKAYLMAKLLADPYMSESEYEYHYRDFLEGYYGEAAEYIEKYHEHTIKMIKKSEEQNGHLKSRSFGIDENFVFVYNTEAKTYDMTDIDYINDLWENAVYMTYGEQLDHVKKSRIHWTYIELYNTTDKRMLWGDDLIKAELRDRNRELYYDIIKYKTTKLSNGKGISLNVTDFNISPKSWF